MCERAPHRLCTKIEPHCTTAAHDQHPRMASESALSSVELEEAYQVASLYAELRSLQRVAETLCLNRRRADRLLDLARANGIYHEYAYAVPPGDGSEWTRLRTELKARYPRLDRVEFVPGRTELLSGAGAAQLSEDIAATRQALYRTAVQIASREVDHLLGDQDVLCLPWGQTVHAVVQFLRAMRSEPYLKSARNQKRLPNLRVVPMLGILSPRPDAVEANSLVREMASVYGTGRYYCLPIPAFVRDPKLKDAVVNLPVVETVMKRIRRASFVVASVAAPDPQHSALVKRKLLRSSDIQEVQERGAVGELSAWWFDGEGRRVPHPTIEPIGLDLDALRGIVERGGTVMVVVAGDPTRIVPLRAALQGKFVNFLVTDAGTAASVLAD